MGAMHARGLTGAPLRAALAVVLVCVAGAGAACGSTITPPRVVSDADNGHSVTVRRGAIIRLVLHSTYWRPHGSSAPSVVAVSGAPKYVAQSGGIAGSGNGTVTETLEAIGLTQRAGWLPIVSARSGETEDAFISHLVVASNAGQLKVGSFSRSERMAKWNEVIRIQEHLGDRARFVGGEIFGGLRSPGPQR